MTRTSATFVPGFAESQYSGEAFESVGGFLGMGTHLVVVRYDSLKFADNKIVLPGGTNEALKMLPAFEYSKE